MEKKQGIMKLLRSLKGKKGLDTVIIIVIIAAIAFIYFTSFAPPAGSGEPSPAPTPQQAQAAGIEQRLARVLSSISGAGEVEVMVTYESGSQLVPAMNTKTQTDTQEQNQSGNQSTTKSETTSNELVTVQKEGSSEAVVLREDQPKVRGVVVIAKGAGDISVRMQLAQAVCTVLDVDPSQVEVFVMK
ncbi:MAG: hypothetical protein ACOX8O_06885 [Christensenellales bacterium]|jgi:stage III sporulation protein AG